MNSDKRFLLFGGSIFCCLVLTIFIMYITILISSGL